MRKPVLGGRSGKLLTARTQGHHLDCKARKLANRQGVTMKATWDDATPVGASLTGSVMLFTGEVPQELHLRPRQTAQNHI